MQNIKTVNRKLNNIKTEDKDQILLRNKSVFKTYVLNVLKFYRTCHQSAILYRFGRTYHWKGPWTNRYFKIVDSLGISV